MRGACGGPLPRRLHQRACGMHASLGRVVRVCRNGCRKPGCALRVQLCCAAPALEAPDGGGVVLAFEALAAAGRAFCKDHRRAARLRCLRCARLEGRRMNGSIQAASMHALARTVS